MSKSVKRSSLVRTYVREARLRDTDPHSSSLWGSSPAPWGSYITGASPLGKFPAWIQKFPTHKISHTKKSRIFPAYKNHTYQHLRGSYSRSPHRHIKAAIFFRTMGFGLAHKSRFDFTSSPQLWEKIRLQPYLRLYLRLLLYLVLERLLLLVCSE